MRKRDCAFRTYLDRLCLPVYGIFKLKYLNLHTIDYNKILHTDKDHQILFVGGPNTDGRHLENRKSAISPERSTDLCEIWYDDAWPSNRTNNLSLDSAPAGRGHISPPHPSAPTAGRMSYVCPFVCPLRSHAFL